MAVQELEGNKVMVTMSITHWNLLQQLERSYKVARSIMRGEKECESAPALSAVEALRYIESAYCSR